MIGNKLPENWAVASLQDIATINPTLDKSAFEDDMEVSFIPMPAVEAETGKTDISQIKKFGEVKKGYTPFQEKDVLFAKITPCMENGKMAVVPKLTGDLGFGSTEFHVLRARNDIEPKYIYYFVSSKAFRYDAEHHMTGAVGQRRVPTGFIEAQQVPLPPTNEQKCIVAKIEELFSELDKGVENLKTARVQLKVYRQAVLKHAFEGKLTAKWREENQDNLNNKTIFEKFINTGSLSSLPDSWSWIKSGSLFSFVTSGSRGWAKYYSDSGSIFIRIGNLDFDSLNLDLSDIQYVSPPVGAEGKRTQVKKGDFLFSITGYLGMFAITPELEDAYVNQHIALARPVNGFNPEYVGYYITSRTGGHFYLNGLTKGAVKAGLRLDDIRSFPVPICSEQEQQKIVEQIESKFSVIDQIEKDIETNIQKSESLRQSILKKAFSGQLVEQDQNDEPASVLLERLRVEKESQNSKPKKTKSKRKAA